MTPHPPFGEYFFAWDPAPLLAGQHLTAGGHEVQENMME